LISGERVKSFFLKNKKWVIISALFIFGVLMLIGSAASVGGAGNAEGEPLSEYKERLEEELEETCSAIKGVGKCRVTVTFVRGEENTYKGSTLVESKPPRVLGVSVVCRGADSSETKHALVEMLTALFDIGSNRISVLKLNS
jgi:hypothetical protein